MTAAIESGDRHPRLNVLGVGVSAITQDIALETIRGWITQGAQQFVTVTGVHGVMESQRDEPLRRIHNRAGMVTPDGMPLVWLLRRNGHPHASRVYGPDLMLNVCRASEAAGWKHYLYGSTPEVLTDLQASLERQFPALQIVGSFSPPFRPLTADEDDDVIARIDASGAHIVWVGLSTPRQEHWMAAHVGRVQANVLIGVGAAFDFHAGRKKQAPGWMQRRGLEWLFRLVTEPRRLWKRYLRNNPLFIANVLRQRLGLRRYTLDE